MTTTTPTPSSDLTIPVAGMTCAACGARIQRVLERTEGVSAANVNLMTSSATVSYDPSSVTPDRLVEAIRDTGYGAELPAADASAEGGALYPALGIRLTPAMAAAAMAVSSVSVVANSLRLRKSVKSER